MNDREITVLVCDDEPDVRLWLRVRLRALGYEVVEASGGAECLTRARSGDIELVILDINMPEMDGFAVCAELRRHPQTRHVPIVMLTAQRTAVDDRVRGLKLGADDYLPKDVAPSELAARLETVLRRALASGDVNPLTKLPGNTVITDEIDRRILARKPFAVAWADLDNFKAFNDRYGFIRGDKMILETAKALRDAIEERGGDEDFLGHIGGDDFVIVSDMDRIAAIAEAATKFVDERLPYLYDLDDRARGQIRAVDRNGSPQSFPLATISIAVVQSQAHRFLNVLQVAEAASEVKKVAKQRRGSQIVIDRRVR